MRKLKILVALTYYRPHISGLTIYVERLCRALVARGHEVLVLTSQYDNNLPREDVLDGVRVFRVPVALRVSKGVVMPTIGYWATKFALWADVMSVHLPQLDAAGLTGRGRLFGKPTLLTYHSDLLLPPGLVNWTANRVVDMVNHLAGISAHRLCAYTEDFAKHSRFLSKYPNKVTVISPPVEMREPSAEEIAAWAAAHGVHEGARPVIGIAARLAAEKGIEYLLDALPAVLAKYPNAQVLHAGPTETVIGEGAYMAKLKPLLEAHKAHYHFLGPLSQDEMALFFSNCDVHVLPSINNTETFGLVQIEAALCGCPSVASALPGVRMPTKMTGMGLSVPPMDSAALAEGILKVLDNRADYVRPRAEIAAMFSSEATAEKYEAWFYAELAKRGKG